MKRAAIVLLIFGLVGSAHGADPEFVKVSPDTYMVVIQNKAGIFGSLPRTRAKAIDAANRFAESQGMTAIPVGMNSTPAGGPGQWPTVEYQFRVVQQGDPEYRRMSLTPAPDTFIEVNVNGQAAASPAPAVDAYTELLKLDDLRKRGILTEDEFQAEKTKLLSATP